MFGPGRYVPDPTEGIIHVEDLPAPQVRFYSRDSKQTPCPRCGHGAPRHKGGQRTLHDLGDLYTDRPVDLVVAFMRFRQARVNIASQWPKVILITDIEHPL